MLQPENFYSVLTPMYYTTKIFGLAPFNVSGENFTKSKANLIWSISLMIFLNTYTSFGLCSRPNSNIIARFIARITDIAAAYLTQLSLCFGILFECIFVNKILESIDDINKFDQEVRKNFRIDIITEYRKSTVYLITALFVVSIYLIIVISSTALASVRVLTFATLGELLAYVAPQVINTFVEFQFCTLILCLKQRFVWLNKSIVLVSRSLENKLHEYENIFSVTLKAKQIRPTTHTVASGFLQDQTMDVIEKIRLKHHDLCTICKNVNVAFSVQLLFTVVTILITVIILLYYGGKHVLLDPDLPLYYLIQCAVQISFGVAQVMTLITVCSKTALEARKTGILVHNTISLQQEYNYKEDLQLGISAFSLQLLHQNVEFTACGMFVIDETLLMTIIGAITTYLVFVVQFEVAEIRSSQLN